MLGFLMKIVQAVFAPKELIAVASGIDPKLWLIVRGVVAAVELIGNLKGEEKRKEAIKRAKKELAQAGITASNRAVNAAVEMAVEAISKKA